MTTKIRIAIAGFTLAVVFGLIYTSPATSAQGDDDLTKIVKNIAASIKKGDADAAKKQAAAAAKNVKVIEEISDVMHMYRGVDKGGLGIENDLKKPAGKNPEELGNLVRAMAEVTLAKGWDKNQGKRTKKAWNDLTEEMRTAAVELTKAKGDAAVAKAAEKVNNSCTRCHMVFKD